VVDEASAPNLIKLHKQMMLELQESQRKFADSQRKFAADMDKKLKKALSDDRTLAEANSKKPKQNGKFQIKTMWTAWGETDQVEYTEMTKKTYTSVLRDDGDGLLTLGRESTREIELSGREHTENQLAWVEEWMGHSDAGELDIYTCLALSNCFSWTPDTQRIFAKAVAVTFLQMVVPFCLLLSEFSTGIELGPASGDLAFRVTGFTLYGYAVYNMYGGASDQCRTSLLNLAFHYKDMEAGNWLPLVFGEFSNVFTGVVLVVALYSIFTTQTAPADLILNAVAVNFLGDCDSAFVSEDMKDEAQATFKELTSGLFSDPNNDHVHDPNYETWPAKLSRWSLTFIAVCGIVGCVMFLLLPMHKAGLRDIAPGFEHHVVWFNKTMNKFNQTLENIEHHETQKL